MSVQAPERPIESISQSVIDISSLPEDVLTYVEAERLAEKAKKLGSVALEGAAELQSQSRFPNLHEAIKAAAEGCPEAKKFVKANIRADAVERTMKAGIVMDVDLEQTEDGKLKQYGQTLEDVHVNTMVGEYDAYWQARVMAEARNSIRLQRAFDQGLLEDNYFVVFSLYPTEVSDVKAKSYGFFTQTKTTSIQATTILDGRVNMESSYVAGVTEPGKVRHDIDAVVAIGRHFGTSYEGKTDAEILDMPLLVHKGMMPNGVINIDALFDTFAGETFMGQDKPVQDYIKFREDCRQIVADFEPKVDLIYDDLIAEKDVITSPHDAVRMLNRLSANHMVMYAVENNTIDSMTFGADAAVFIHEARIAYDQGRFMEMSEKVGLARQVEESGSCPNGIDGKKDNEAKDSLGDCEFVSKACPICNTKNVKTKTTSTSISGSCGCSVKNGVVTRKHGGHKTAHGKKIEDKRSAMQKRAKYSGNSDKI